MRLQDTEKLIKAIDKNRSIYDPGRDTVGAIYRNAQLTGEKAPILVGDMANELTKDLVTDINEALCAPRKSDKPFYLMIHEKKDLQMKSAILRRLLYFTYRPYPEDDTTVFWKDPKTQEVRFCWSLPHWSEMDNMLANPEQFDKDFIADIKAWKAVDLKHFGFYHGGKKWGWLPNPNHKDKKLEPVKTLKPLKAS